MSIPTNLKSRKLWAFIITALLVVANNIFSLGWPTNDVLYLITLTASYILGQGYVDAKQQVVTHFPVDDFSASVTNIIHAEIAKTGFGKNLPMESIIDLVRTVVQQEMSTLSISVSPTIVQAPIVAPTDPTIP